MGNKHERKASGQSQRGMTSPEFQAMGSKSSGKRPKGAKARGGKSLTGANPGVEAMEW